MPSKRWPRRPSAPSPVRRTVILLCFLLMAAILITVGLLFRSLITEMAVSDAQDAVVSAINSIVKSAMMDESFAAEKLVTLEKDTSGNIAAVTTNVAAVNILAANILERAVSLTEKNVITVGIPLGNLTGNALLLNRGPDIHASVIMLSSSMAGFRSEMKSAGINQTHHQILLDLNVEISLLMPWRTIDTSVETEVLVSETVIVGAVPESYMNWER